MAKLKTVKVTALPATLAADTMYLVSAGGSNVKVFVTNSVGVVIASPVLGADHTHAASEVLITAAHGNIGVSAGDDLDNAMGDIDSVVGTIVTDIGVLSALNTVDKTSLVAAINEVLAIGGITDHTALSNIGVNTHAQIDTHLSDNTVHFSLGSIDHAAILNIGSNTHAQIDTHITGSADDHTQYSIISSQIGVPSSTPVRAGAINIDSTAGDIYISKAAVSSADWIKVNGGGVSIGDAIGSGVNTALLYVGPTGDLANDADLNYDGSNLSIDDGFVDTLNGFYQNGLHLVSTDTVLASLRVGSNQNTYLPANSTILGDRAAEDTTAGATGTTLVGARAGEGAGLGNQNTGVGERVLLTVSGLGNSGYGYNSCTVSGIGAAYNVGMGYQALARNSGSYNISIGYQGNRGNAGIEDWDHSISVGQFSMNWIAADNPNYTGAIAIGKDSLRTRGDVSRTVAFGYEVGYNSTNGGYSSTDSIFLGSYMGKYAQTNFTLEIGSVDNKPLISGNLDTSSDAGWVEINGITVMNGGQRLARTSVSDVDYQVTTKDYLIAVTALTAPRTVTLPVVISGEYNEYVIKDEVGLAGTHTITIKVAAGNIDATLGTTGITITTNYGKVRVYTNGVNYYTI